MRIKTCPKDKTHANRELIFNTQNDSLPTDFMRNLLLQREMCS